MNTKHDLGLPSANKVSTHQHNRDERLPDITWHTKGMLRKLLYLIWDERMKAKRDYERLLVENRELRTQILGMQAKEINSLRGRDVFMKVAV